MLQTAVLEYVEEVGQSARLLELTCFIHREAKVIISPSQRQVSIPLLLMQHLTVSYAWPLRQQLLTTRSSGTPRMSVNKPLQLSKMSRKSHTSLHASLYKFVIIASVGRECQGRLRNGVSRMGSFVLSDATESHFIAFPSLVKCTNSISQSWAKMLPSNWPEVTHVVLCPGVNDPLFSLTELYTSLSQKCFCMTGGHLTFHRLLPIPSILSR